MRLMPAHLKPRPMSKWDIEGTFNSNPGNVWIVRPKLVNREAKLIKTRVFMERFNFLPPRRKRQ